MHMQTVNVMQSRVALALQTQKVYKTCAAAAATNSIPSFLGNLRKHYSGCVALSVCALSIPAIVIIHVALIIVKILILHNTPTLLGVRRQGRSQPEKRAGCGGLW